jgi:type I restriction enzyme S subunit
MGSVINNPTIKKHSLYKDSGVKWLEKIPSNWHSKPLFTIGKVISKVNCQDRELLSVYLERGVIKFSDVTEKRTNVTSEDLSKYQAVDPGNLVLNNQQAWRGSVGVSKYSGIVSPAYIVLALSDEIDYDFANYLFRDSTMVSHYLICSKGVGTIQRNLYWPQLKRVNVCIPPLPEQTAIAEFLDRKTVLIDQAIDIKQKQIELLKERRQILIHKAVTRGLNPNVKMKDSGVEWIGEIPEGWEVAKVKQYSIKISKGTTPSTEGRSILDEGAIRYIKAENIQDGLITDSPAHFIDEKTNSMIKRSQLQENDILFVIAGATLGKTAIVSNEHIPSNTNQAVAFVRPSSTVIPKYLASWLTSSIIKELTWLVAVQSAQPNLSMENLGNFPIIMPSLEDQKDILTHIDNESSKITTAISLKGQEIEKLKEYKTTLINSAVTGKIKVYNDAK